MPRIRYSYAPVSEIRRHYIDGNDVDVLLSRLPEEVWSRLRAVHFNDRSWGRRRLGYANGGGRNEIAICALPPRVSLTKFLDYPRFRQHRSHRSPRHFGALRGRQWPELAVRRFTLYHVFLHELGHLQIVDSKAKRIKRKFAGETKAQEFADYWRAQLWLTSFDHSDQVHNPPSAEELRQLEEVATKYPAEAAC